jgi:hypothetical protein
MEMVTVYLFMTIPLLLTVVIVSTVSIWLLTSISKFISKGLAREVVPSIETVQVN